MGILCESSFQEEYPPLPLWVKVVARYGTVSGVSASVGSLRLALVLICVGLCAQVSRVEPVRCPSRRRYARIDGIAFAFWLYAALSYTAYAVTGRSEAAARGCARRTHLF